MTSDLVLLAELASAASVCKDVDDVLLWTCHLVFFVLSCVLDASSCSFNDLAIRNSDPSHWGLG